MDELRDNRQRRHVRWGKEARQLVVNYLAQERDRAVGDDRTPDRKTVRSLVTALTNLTGNARDACLRFVRQLGVTAKQQHRGWTVAEQQRLLDLVALNPP